MPVTGSFEVGGAMQLSLQAATRYSQQAGLEWRDSDATAVTDFLTELRLRAYVEAFGGFGFDFSLIALKIGLFGKLDVNSQNRFLSREYLEVAIPYNAKAKPIERVFNTFESQLGKMFPSYAGSNAKKRPEDLKDLDIMEVITLEEFIVRHNKYVYEIYNNDPHSGKAMYKQSPNHWYSELEFTLRRVSKDVLYFSLMRVKGTRVVGRNGITFNGVHFYNDNCINYIRQKVLAKYDPTKPEILYVFDLNENFLFIAEEVPQIGWSLNQEDYEQMNHRNKVARQKALNNYTADNVIRSTESIGERLNRQAESAGQSPIAKPKKMEIIRNGKLEETVRRITLSDIERNYEDTLKQERERKLAVTSKQKELAERFKNNMLERAYRNQA